MLKTKEQKAITLIALVITIIVLIILAGVAINLTLGENGIFNRAKEAREKTALAELKEKADLEHLELKMEDLEKDVKLSQIVDELKKQGYTIVEKNNGENKITGVTATPENPTVGIGETIQVELTINKEENPTTQYYAKIYDAYYEITLENNEIKIRRKDSKSRC